MDYATLKWRADRGEIEWNTQEGADDSLQGFQRICRTVTTLAWQAVAYNPANNVVRFICADQRRELVGYVFSQLTLRNLEDILPSIGLVQMENELERAHHNQQQLTIVMRGSEREVVHNSAIHAR